ncbi:hypothetical protein ASPVEDRAFT_31228 [Aspergillus versicolor CBS 583.65]|uniref:F-box domain-containing protein n=1 Tax=Aspergillus versicolor CBS 583.65 TaxID=1036611 RepID=A0A1L9PTG1_ASPVE|nr:uncharacterized protein ASPVEDRAFT_31228 [Aspergillus versicolor CBS 583.65]OJJ04791.1 hypothetical protein ASPVEDRAFT_31228 [Aspergillus versicolor CBS 583.65]
MHYCCICGGPVSSLDLRKASLANDGDDLNRCYKDECDCIGDECEEVDCPGQFGYNSQVLLEEDVAWLDKVVMICPSMNNNGTGSSTGSQSGAYLTAIGDYDEYDSLVHFPDTSTKCPNRDGFVAHDCCLRTLFLAESNSSKKQSQLTLESLFFTMKRFAVPSPEKAIDWKDSRLYGGGVHGFQGSDKWEALYGYEWLVSDPEGYTNIARVLNYAAHPKIVALRSPIWGPLKLKEVKESTTAKEDTIIQEEGFKKLPFEVQLMIIELLSSKDVHNLSLASRAICNATRYLPNSFWKTRLGQGRFGYLAPFRGDLTWPSVPVNYFRLLCRLENVSRPWPHGDQGPLGENEQICPYWNSLKNWRRIWGCCEAILDKVNAYDNAIMKAAA